MGKPRIKKTYVIIDTCIIQHLANQELANGIIQELEEALSVGYELALSEYTLFETVDGATPEKEEERLEAMMGVKSFYVRKRVFRVAARLHSFY